jgi:hypothetical protein
VPGEVPAVALNDVPLYSFHEGLSFRIVQIQGPLQLDDR